MCLERSNSISVALRETPKMMSQAEMSRRNMIRNRNKTEANDKRLSIPIHYARRFVVTA
jgi:hypothetical protein